jgi:hypothetical protein
MNKHLMLTAVALAAALLTPGEAEAGNSAYMFGLGLHLGTMVIPAKYPAAFPKEIRNNADSELTRIQGDGHFGLEGVYYLDESNRVGFSGSLGFGSNYFDDNLLLKYARVKNFGAADAIVGAGIGIGKSRFRTDGKEELETPYYPLRVEAGPVFRQEFLAEQVLLYTQYNFTWDHVYTNPDGELVEVGTGFYGMIGAEVHVMFGDFSR